MVLAVFHRVRRVRRHVRRASPRKPDNLKSINPIASKLGMCLDTPRGHIEFQFQHPPPTRYHDILRSRILYPPACKCYTTKSTCPIALKFDTEVQ